MLNINQMKSETLFYLCVCLLSIAILIPWIKPGTETDAGNLEKDSGDENSLISLVIKFILGNRLDCPYHGVESILIIINTDYIYKYRFILWSILIIGTWYFWIPMWPGIIFGVPWFLIHCFDSALLSSLLQFSILHPSPENIPLYSTNLTVENA